MATVDLHAADSVEALRYTFDRIEDSQGARAEDDTAVAMEGEIVNQGEEGEQNRWWVGVQGSTPHRRAKHYQLQGRCHLAAPSPGPTHPGAPRAADHTDLDPKNCNAIGPMLTILHRRRARRLRLRPRQHHSQQDAKGRRQIGRDGAWVRREESRCSRDPPAHFQEVPIRRYSGCPQPFPSNAGSPNAHAMLLGRKSPTAAPHWKDRST